MLLIVIALAASAQLSLKKGIKRFGKFKIDKNLFKTLPKLFTRPYVILGASFYFIGTILWIAVLSQLDLSYVYPMEALSYFFVALFSMFLFKEKVSKYRWTAITIIVLGVAILAFS